MRGRRPCVVQPEWMKALRVGDVLQRGKYGPFRIVREVHVRHGRVYSVQFVKRVRNRYASPFTILYVSELLVLGYHPVGARVKLTSDLDRRLAEALHCHTHHSVSCECRALHDIVRGAA